MVSNKIVKSLICDFFEAFLLNLVEFNETRLRSQNLCFYFLCSPTKKVAVVVIVFLNRFNLRKWTCSSTAKEPLIKYGTYEYSSRLV